MEGITHIIEHLELPEEVKVDVVAVYQLIAEAESHVHGKTVEEIHFHEVGTADAIADIAGVCLLMHMIAPQKVIASPIHVGSGNVHCAHGILPVPAPATAFILQGLPIYSGVIKGELCNARYIAYAGKNGEQHAADDRSRDAEPLQQPHPAPQETAQCQYHHRGGEGLVHIQCDLQHNGLILFLFL